MTTTPTSFLSFPFSRTSLETLDGVLHAVIGHSLAHQAKGAFAKDLTDLMDERGER
jgi:hypothetical protein